MHIKKSALGQRALDLGLLKDPGWLERLDEQVPLWVVLEIAFQLMETMDPPTTSYD
ncbi:hypothetical protein ACFVVQ_01735 [Paenibacillus chitinolyticus]|uniref:Uncharacterized protein n=1 Tax=Paenibacillus chitinolyticus TaxID=79263 RepID=A0ABT4F755_9BACL|nr:MULTISPECIES: hypothetical protein [Paenibacillus]EGL15966.1 hypothetical protein HMPREF9413_0088 [Paenibacillus sp. HGF7]EPD80879.1 hypothetical protein HMPREF1207_04636 [Paenibacillus sp. HGH0039]MBV6714744.1 hypothetical protein [Paenibacillus chitinolyticus]MCY9589269.1 hypothetical protein [Paenibacillus chitinolyticus]MCY9594342.1 hypothetical protein [Paenibacillus chitinolyticus]